MLMLCLEYMMFLKNVPANLIIAHFGLKGRFGDMSWKDKQVAMFRVKRQNNPKCPILLCTPLWDYGLSIEDFKKVRNEILEFDIDGN